MNSPAHPVRHSPLYDEDAYGWAMAQAALLRARKLDQVDWENIAEEIEDMGQSQYDALESALRVLLLHLLKWDYQPLFRSRSWVLTVREQHRQYERRLKRNPGLKSVSEEMRSEAYHQARVAAATETGLSLETFPIEPYGWNVINNPPVSEDDLPSR